MLVSFSGEILRAERTRLRISQTMLADRTGCSIRHIRALETGRKRSPSARLLCKIAKVLDVPMETFMVIQYEESDAIPTANR